MSLMKLIEDSTIHGLHHFSQSKTPRRRVGWLVVSVMGFCGFCINFHWVLLRYRNQPPLSSYSLDSEPFIWPDITFCNPSAPFPLTDARIRQHWQGIRQLTESYANLSLFQLIRDLNEDLGKLSSPEEPVEPSLVEQSFLLSSYDPSIYLHPDTLRAHDVPAIFFSTLKDSDSIAFSEKNKHSLWNYPHSTGASGHDNQTWPFDSSQFVQMRYNIPCQTFSPSKQFTAKELDRTRMISFLVNIQHESHRRFNFSYLPPAVYLHITAPGQQLQGEGSPILAAFNHDVYITMEVRHFLRGVQPCRDYDFTQHYYDGSLQPTHLLARNITYEDCCKVISQEHYLRHCGCYSPYLPLFPSELHTSRGGAMPDLCLNISRFTVEEMANNSNCMERVYLESQETPAFNEELQLRCQHLKQRKCRQVEYQKRVNQDMWLELWGDTMNHQRNHFMTQLARLFGRRRSSGVSEREEEERNMIFLKKNVALLSVHRTSQYNDVMQFELEYPLSEFLSDLGGMIGLWIGLSVIGVFELVHYLLFSARLSAQWCYHRCHMEQRADPISTAV